MSGRENDLGVKHVVNDLELLDKIRIPCRQLSALIQELYALRAMYGELMPTVLERLKESIYGRVERCPQTAHLRL